MITELFNKINQKHLLFRKNNRLFLKKDKEYILINQNDVFYAHLVEVIPNAPHAIEYGYGDFYTSNKNKPSLEI